jgi:Integrase core domain
MSNDVTRFLNDCPTCCQARLKRQGRTRKLKLFPPTCALEQVAIDILGPLPVTSRGHRYILVMTDRFSKLTRAIPLKGITAAEVALAFVEVWVASYGVLLFLLSDNGSQFVSKLFQRVAQLLGITQLFSTPYHPFCNGQVERFNSTILD